MILVEINGKAYGDHDFLLLLLFYKKNPEMLNLAKQEKPWERRDKGSGQFYIINLICKET